jgi:tungstate transport system substrate-binding protein
VALAKVAGTSGSMRETARPPVFEKETDYAPHEGLADLPASGIDRSVRHYRGVSRGAGGRECCGPALHHLDHVHVHAGGQAVHHRRQDRGRKPGRTFWTPVKSVTIGLTGRWSWKYTPKLGGKFYIRARYGTTAAGLSRTATLTVRKGPGVTYQIALASTTSTRDSGLFEALKPMFLAACPEYSLKATFVGSGAAIALGGSGDADVLLTHSPAAEVNFMNGLVGSPLAAVPHHGVRRYKVMYNDYVLVGPTANPAGILITDSAQSAFEKIANTDSVFWSRNDASGTNSKEKEIWALLGNPQLGQSWYKASGTMGMAQALAAANDASTGGYTLSDRATWLNANSLGMVKALKIVSENDPSGRYNNQYAVIEVSEPRNWEGARDFSLWIRSAQGQAVIRDYGLDTYGKSLFIPNAGPY